MQHFSSSFANRILKSLFCIQITQLSIKSITYKWRMPWKQNECRNYSSRTTKTVWLHHRWRRSPKNNLYKEAKNNKIYQSTDIGNKKQK